MDPVLPPITAQPVAPLIIRGPLQHIKTNNDDIDTTPVPMDLEPEMSTPAPPPPPQSSVAVSQADIENELREFLEGGAAGNLIATGHDAAEANVLDQIMMQ